MKYIVAIKEAVTSYYSIEADSKEDAEEEFLNYGWNMIPFRENWETISLDAEEESE